MIFKITIAALFTAVSAFQTAYKEKPKFKTFTDPRDKQEYQIVKIGKQWWFAENLNYEIEKSWCFQCETYGRMYTYESALAACPKGWHVPSVAEWKELIEFLGGEDKAGGKMKTIEKWAQPNVGANNSSGFSAIPAPERGTSGEIRNPYEATWWTADKALEPAAWTYSIQPGNSGIYCFGYYRVSGFSVRCIKDE